LEASLVEDAANEAAAIESFNALVYDIETTQAAV